MNKSLWSQSHFCLTPYEFSLLELLLVNTWLSGWWGSIIMCVEIYRKIRGRATTPFGSEKSLGIPFCLWSYVTWAWPVRWPYVILEGLKQKEGSVKTFLWPLSRVQSPVVQEPRVLQSSNKRITRGDVSCRSGSWWPLVMSGLSQLCLTWLLP